MSLKILIDMNRSPDWTQRCNNTDGRRFIGPMLAIRVRQITRL